MNLARLLWDSAMATPESEALTFGAARVKYAAFASRAAAVHEFLHACGVRPGDRVAVLLPHDTEAPPAIYGVVAAGAIVTVLNWLFRPRQVEQILDDYNATVLLTTRSWEAMQPRPLTSPARVVHIEDIPLIGTAGPMAVAGATPAQITYTSGSTGKPKGVVMTHDTLHIGIRTVVEYLELRPDDRIASLLPLSFVYGFNQLNCAIATGARLDLIDSVLALEIVRALAERESTVLAAVPPLWMQLLRVGEFAQPLPALRILTCAGGRLSPEGVRALRLAQPQARLYLMYGLTEVFRSTYLPPDEVDAHPDSMGRAVPGSRVYVLRDDGSPCSDGEIGELVHAGPTVGSGYWNDPVATQQVFVSNPVESNPPPSLARAVRSGDLVRRDATGLLYYVGRRDQMIKTLGFRVSPDEIADVLYASQLVTDAAVTSEPDPHRGDRIIAHVVLVAGASLDALRVFCGTELPRHLQPARWDLRESLPRNASGKHDLSALRADPSAG